MQFTQVLFVLHIFCGTSLSQELSSQRHLDLLLCPSEFLFDEATECSAEYVGLSCLYENNASNYRAECECKEFFDEKKNYDGQYITYTEELKERLWICKSAENEDDNDIVDFNLTETEDAEKVQDIIGTNSSYPEFDASTKDEAKVSKEEEVQIVIDSDSEENDNKVTEIDSNNVQVSISSDKVTLQTTEVESDEKMSNDGLNVAIIATAIVIPLFTILVTIVIFFLENIEAHRIYRKKKMGEKPNGDGIFNDSSPFEATVEQGSPPVVDAPSTSSSTPTPPLESFASSRSVVDVYLKNNIV